MFIETLVCKFLCNNICYNFTHFFLYDHVCFQKIIYLFIYFCIIQRIVTILLIKMFLNETQALIFNVLIYLTCKHEQNIRFDYVTNSKVQDITSKDNKYFHINLLGCKQLQFQHVTITAPADSPNTMEST